jgi:hypothetical protein
MMLVPAGYTTDPLLEYLRELPGLGGMSPPQRAFHESWDRKRFLRWPNQTGKTRAGAAEAWWHALGDHPFREVPEAPNIGSILCADLKNGWSKLSAKMREIQPPGILHPECSYDDARGYYFRGKRGIGLINGSLIQAFGSEQPLTALASDTVDWQWIDEPPKRSHWGEFRRSGYANRAPCWVTLTPIGRPVEWLRDIVSGNPEQGHPPLEPDWLELVGKLDREHCPHRSQQSIDEQIAETDALDRGQRIEARWTGFSIGRRIPGFSEENIIDDGDVEALQIEELGLGADWGEVASHTVWYLVGWTGTALYVLAEWSPPERMTEAEEVRTLRKQMLRPWGVDFDQIAIGRGDSNSSGRRGIASTVNQLINRAVAHELGRSRPPFEMRPPYKGPGSVRARARIISSACIEGRLYVHESCQRLIHSYRHWMGENNDLKHPFDAAGYIAEYYLSPVTRSGAAYTLVR